ncbi:MAG: hypothetical protein R2828_05535 [Saprospiraceae bacterium]
MELEMARCFAWSVAAYRLSTYRLTTFLFHAGSTNIESRWDWKWLGVLLGLLLLTDLRLTDLPTYDFSLSCWLYQY